MINKWAKIWLILRGMVKFWYKKNPDESEMHFEEEFNCWNLELIQEKFKKKRLKAKNSNRRECRFSKSKKESNIKDLTQDFRMVFLWDER